MTIERPGNSAPKDLVRGIDTLRFFAALWVAFSHGVRFPVEKFISQSGPLETVLIGLSKMVFNGTAAVAVFFVISGFCIHYPNVGRPHVDWRTFLVRRGIRIGVPLLAVLGILTLAGPEYVGYEDRVLWSIYCEIVYYALYPLLFRLSKVAGFGKITAASVAVSLGLLLYFPSSIYLWEFRNLTWLFCAPLWLLGAVLADLYKEGKRFPQVTSIWVWRAAAVSACVLTTIIAHHLPGGYRLGYTWTMLLFGVFCVVWLGVEFAYFADHPPLPVFETLGAFSYSLYLVHRPIVQHFLANPAPLQPLIFWALQLILVFAVAWLFFLIFERPAHRVAKRITIRGRRSPSDVVA